MDLIEAPTRRGRFVRFLTAERSQKTTGIITTVSALLCPVLLTLLCLFIGTQNYAVHRMWAFFRAPMILLLNFIPVALVLWVIYLLTNRLWIAWTLTSLSCFLLTYTNYFKVALRGEPLVYDDFLTIGEGVGILDQYTLRFPLSFFLTILLLTIIGVFLFFFAKGKLRRKWAWGRIVGLGLCVALGIFSWKQWYTDYYLYTNTRISIQDSFSPWRDEEATAAGGLFWSLLREVDEAYPDPPEGYTLAEAESILGQFPSEPIPERQRVNVIATMLESYSDLSVLTQVAFREDPYAEFHALQQESYSGTLVADSIGGGTINAERSFLTGFTYRHPAYQRNTQSFVRYFAENGYQTVGAHPGHNWFYSRDKIARFLGFEEYRFAEDDLAQLVTAEHSYHGYLDDEVFFSQLRQAYEERETDRPYFSFNVTFQGHSPYPEDSFSGTEYLSHDGLSDGAYNMVNNYLNSVADTGRQVAAFVDSFREDEEPVVLVFFGDHKPTLGADNCYYGEMGIDFTRSGTGRLATYATPYLIWANDAAKAVLGQDFAGEGDTISPCYLMSEVFDCCGWTGPSWLQFQRSVRSDIPVMQMQYFVLSRNGLTMSHTETAREAHDQYQYIEFYVRNSIPK